MDELDIPILKKSYNLYKYFHTHRYHIPKQDRYIIWQRCENLLLDLLQNIMLASYKSKADKITILYNASNQLNFIRLLVRLAKDIKSLDNKKYILIQNEIDEIGRMLGGWIKSLKGD